MKKEMTWRQLLLACKKFGKDKIITILEEQHKALESMAADMWGDYETQGIARKLDASLLKQDETIIKLKQLTDSDIDKLLAAARIADRIEGERT